MSWQTLYQNDVAKFKKLKNYYQNKIRTKMPFIKTILKYAHGSSKPIVELGAGTGLISAYLCDYCNVVALDCDQQMLDLSRQMVQSLQLKSPTYVHGNFFDLSYAESTFSVAFSNGVLEHYSDEQI